MRRKRKPALKITRIWQISEFCDVMYLLTRIIKEHVFTAKPNTKKPLLKRIYIYIYIYVYIYIYYIYIYI